MNNRLPKDYCNLHFEEETTRWDEALPLGNGLLGCLVWGKSEGLRLSLDRADLWDSTPSDMITQPYFNYKSLMKLAKEGKEEEIRHKFSDPYFEPSPTKLPAGKLVFHFEKGAEMEQTLSLAQAEATVVMQKAEKTIQLKTYIHATKPLGFVHINCAENEFSLSLLNPKFGVTGEKKSTGLPIDSLEQLSYPAPQFGEEGDCQWFLQEVGTQMRYGIVVCKCERNQETYLCYTVTSSNDGDDFLEQAKRLVRENVLSYEVDFPAHMAWWEEFWGKSGISVPEVLFEKNWYLTNYLLGSCSRKGHLPMPLQGLWTADDDALPPWKGDYHHDLNTQMCYIHYLKANHLDEGESFLDYLWSMAPQAAKFARDFYGTNGLCLPSVMALDGTALGGWPMYALTPTNQLWLCQSFERHYRFTGDEVFLKERAYPYIKESATCVLELLQEDANGNYILPLSSSPEIHNDDKYAWVTPNSNYDLSLMQYVFGILLEFSKRIAPSDSSLWQQTLNKLPPLAVNADKVLMLSPDESLMESHRHLAHAMAIHPLRLLNKDIECEKEIIDATIFNLELLGTGLWVGFTFSWMADLYAVQGNGDGAYYQLKLFWERFCTQCGFHVNGDFQGAGLCTFHYRPFTLEGNMCAADALQEMLLQTERGIIDLFPAIPRSWAKKEISFQDFRGERGILISAEYKRGSVTAFVLKPAQSGTYLIHGEFGDKTLCGKENEVFAQTEHDTYSLTLTEGEVYSFTLLNA